MDVIMPQLGETVIEGTVVLWYKSIGDSIMADEPLFDLETDKVTTEILSPATGVLAEILVDTGVSVKIGTRLAVIRTGLEAIAPAVVPNESGEPMSSAAQNQPATHASQRTEPSPNVHSGVANLSPVVRRLMAEHGIKPDQVSGSGAQGRITREDFMAFLKNVKTETLATVTTAPAAAARAATLPKASVTIGGADDLIVPLNKIRQLTGIHMVRSKATSPHALQAVEVDYQRVETARKAVGELWKAREGYSLTYLPFLARAVCVAIAKFPYVNASFSDSALIVHQRIHLGIAVDLQFNGLVVTVVRDAHRMTLSRLATEIYRLTTHARNGKLSAEDLTGGTYTISNSGAYGTLFSVSIINQPQAAILSADAVRKRPVVVEGPDGDTIVIRPVGILTQSFDHRAFDGAYSAAFLRCVKDVIESRDWLLEYSE